MTVALVIGANGDEFDIRIRPFVTSDGVLDFIEDAVEIFFVVDFGELVFAKSKRIVEFLLEPFFIDVVAAGVAVLFSKALGDFWQIGEIGVESDAVSACAVVVPNAVLNLDDDRLFGFGVTFDRFPRVGAGPDDDVVGHRF